MPRKRILLAEDHAEMAQRLRSLLSADYDVDVANDGPALIAAVNARAPDLIISDVMMPGMSGLDAAREILASHPASRIIFVSVRSEPAVVGAALSRGALGYVVKSDAGEELTNAVKIVLDGGCFVSSSAQEALDHSRTPGGRAM